MSGTRMILEVVQRCRFCGREMTCSPLAYAENPFCADCYEERVRLSAPSGPVEWTLEGNYFTWDTPAA
ncbi:hypothetical protein LCGC14_2453700 [marine sediment metagenome]|uniref:Uncharacterized protein n=1 Tax=marine sediment metagenome TaxID=412755 RepID=A0A0F9C2Y0_9ZZZZ